MGRRAIAGGAGATGVAVVLAAGDAEGLTPGCPGGGGGAGTGGPAPATLLCASGAVGSSGSRESAAPLAAASGFSARATIRAGRVFFHHAKARPVMSTVVMSTVVMSTVVMSTVARRAASAGGTRLVVSLLLRAGVVGCAPPSPEGARGTTGRVPPGGVLRMRSTSVFISLTRW